MTYSSFYRGMFLWSPLQWQFVDYVMYSLGVQIWRLTSQIMQFCFCEGFDTVRESYFLSGCVTLETWSLPSLPLKGHIPARAIRFLQVWRWWCLQGSSSPIIDTTDVDIELDYPQKGLLGLVNRIKNIFCQCLRWGLAACPRNDLTYRIWLHIVMQVTSFELYSKKCNGIFEKI